MCLADCHDGSWPFLLFDEPTPDRYADLLNAFHFHRVAHVVVLGGAANSHTPYFKLQPGKVRDLKRRTFFNFFYI